MLVGVVVKSSGRVRLGSCEQPAHQNMRTQVNSTTMWIFFSDMYAYSGSTFLYVTCMEFYCTVTRTHYVMCQCIQHSAHLLLSH